MQEEKPTPFLTTPVAVLIGCVIIALAILSSNGVLKIGSTNNKVEVGGGDTTGTQAAPPARKTEADIVAKLKQYADKLGLDTSKFNSCLNSGQKASLISTDLDEGSSAGVNGTPAFFINGRLLSGALPFEQFKKVIEEELSGTVAANTTRQTVGVGNLPVLGKTDAKVTIVEFSDYQCPFCERFFSQTEGKLKKDYIDTGKVKFYYRDFPLTSIHPGAQKAAEAARCAGDHDKYWQYHDLIFDNQSSIF